MTGTKATECPWLALMGLESTSTSKTGDNCRAEVLPEHKNGGEASYLRRNVEGCMSSMTCPPDDDVGVSTGGSDLCRRPGSGNLRSIGGLLDDILLVLPFANLPFQR
jgi:hypothetical protein